MKNSEKFEEIKTAILPELFRNPGSIGEYGRTHAGKDAMAELSALMEASPVSRLSTGISEIVTKLINADPQKITKKPTWLERFTGKSVETHVLYQVARKKLDTLLDDAEGAAQGVRDVIVAIERLIKTHRAEVNDLQVYIQAGQQYLTENPDAGKPVATDGIEFDNPRERFARKLANLATLLSSHELSVTQMKLTRAQAVDMLDRFEETSRVLVPVWRQHTLTLITTTNMSPAMVAEATKAHEALVCSLAQSVNDLKR